MSKTVFLIYTAIVFGIVVYQNPYLFSTKRLRDVRQEEKLKNYYLLYPTIQKSEIPTQDFDASIFYRGDLDRQGKVDFQGDFKMQPSWSSENINLGIHTASKASPVADQSGVYIGSDSGWFYAFNQAGKRKWRFFSGDADRGIHSTAVLTSTHVYFGTYDGTLYALDKESGLIAWSRRLGQTIGSSPVVYHGSLIVAVETFKPDGYVVRLDMRNGDLLWVSDYLGEQSHSSPVVDVSTKSVLLGANNSKFFSIDLDTGKTKWTVSIAGPMKGTPTRVEDTVYFGDWGKVFWALNIKDGSLKWKKEVHQAVQSSASYHPTSRSLSFYDKDGYYYRVDLDGKTLVEKNLLNSWTITSTVSLTGRGGLERVLGLCEKQTLCLMDLNGKMISQFKMDSILTGVPFVARDRIYVATNSGSLYALEMVKK